LVTRFLSRKRKVLRRPRLRGWFGIGLGVGLPSLGELLRRILRGWPIAVRRILRSWLIAARRRDRLRNREQQQTDHQRQQSQDKRGDRRSKTLTPWLPAISGRAIRIGGSAVTTIVPHRCRVLGRFAAGKSGTSVRALW